MPSYQIGQAADLLGVSADTCGAGSTAGGSRPSAPTAGSG